MLPQTPFSSLEAPESPPSYEEAVKQELFRFRAPKPSSSQRTRSTSLGDPIVTERDGPSTSSHVADASPPNRDVSGPSTTPQAPARPRSSTAASQLASHLSTIEEDEEGETPVTVVIDCIGRQAARLMDKCDTTVELERGDELATHSKC